MPLGWPSAVLSGMDRKQLPLLDDWLARPLRKPLILRGARQVGKSTLVRLFAERCRRPLAEVNLERHPDLASVFARNDPVHLLGVLETLPGVGTVGPDGLLFLDEIQAVPEAIPALRYLREEKADLPVLAAGSLLDFALANHRLSIPVGRVSYLHMGPMTFTEFLKAVGAEPLASRIAAFEMERGLDSVIHRRLLDLLRTYLFTGGMPEAVEAFARSGRYREVSEVHHSIIETYPRGFPPLPRFPEPSAHRGGFRPGRPAGGQKGPGTSASPGRRGRGRSERTSNGCAWRACCRRSSVATRMDCRSAPTPIRGPTSSCSWTSA